jgi:hypothetical protein
MSVMMLRYEVAEEGVEEVARAIEAAFAAVWDQQPGGMRYGYYRRPGGTEFIAVLELADADRNPLLTIPAAAELREAVAKWAIGDQPPVPEPLELIGSYAA